MVDLPERLMVRVQSANERTYYSKIYHPRIAVMQKVLKLL